MFDPNVVKLGKQEKVEDPRTFQAKPWLPSPQLAPPPASRHYGSKVVSWPMYGNDQLGDCTCAAAGHVVQGVTSAAGHAAPPLEKDVLALYWATGSEDDGRVCLDVLKAWRKIGLGGKNKIKAFAEVAPKDHVEVKQAITLFGNVYLGVGLPLSMQGASSWTKRPNLTGRNKPWSWGGHAINAVGFDASGLDIITWGGMIRATWGFIDQYCDEMYVVLSPDWLTLAQTSPALAGALKLDVLEGDLAKL